MVNETKLNETKTIVTRVISIICRDFKDNSNHRVCKHSVFNNSIKSKCVLVYLC